MAKPEIGSTGWGTTLNAHLDTMEAATAAAQADADAAASTASAAIPATEKGAANGVASLGADGLVPSAQLPEAGVSDHGALAGLADDDHIQYALADGSRGSFEAAGAVAAHAAAATPHADYMPRETSARTVYVATAGSDSTGNGTSGSPWATIQHAVNQARSILYPVNGTSGYKIIVSPGTYIETVTIPPTVFGGVDAAGNGGIVIESSTLAYADVTIRATSTYAVNIFGTCSLRGVTIESDDIGVLVRGGSHVQVVVRDCRLQRTSASNGGEAAIYTQFAAIYSRTNVSTAGRLFGHGLKATNGGVIAKLSTQPSGATANEYAVDGGAIR